MHASVVINVNICIVCIVSSLTVQKLIKSVQMVIGLSEK